MLIQNLYDTMLSRGKAKRGGVKQKDSAMRNSYFCSKYGGPPSQTLTIWYLNMKSMTSATEHDLSTLRSFAGTYG
ncbi:hypothetical protein QFZ77_003930 [Paenibacillus sp. V4I3]|uniref:hypothetical protein n=1 Tax=unclassified Paenibacillus TaxID=185978 RepID=UPI002783200D|nr:MULTISPECIES: hypothetical protein [unclassified Paenibacillus]MDQ0875271.1 hypothetical protein [Paenibacillus sp. V4I3]MDQ0888998.1 hypothetical protein [Paenibacillus sp. V4I9]